MIESKRDTLISLFDKARVNGAAYFFCIALLGSATVLALSEITGEDEDTLSKYLRRMESRGLLVRVRDGHADRWHLSPTATQNLSIAQSLLGVATPAKISGVGPSSSSDQRSDQIDPIRSDPEEEEEHPKISGAAGDEADRPFKSFLCHKYGLTGDRAQQVIESSAIYSGDLAAWIYQVHEMQRSGYRFKKSPEAYALHCLLKSAGPESASDAAYANCQPLFDQYWTEFQRSHSNGDIS